MGVHSGKFGVVNNISSVRNWSIADTVSLIEAVASNTKFGKARRNGIHDFTGSFSGYGGTPPVMPGEEFTFQGYTAPDDDVSGNGVIYSAPAIVESVAITWNFQSGDIISWAANIAGNGRLTYSSGEYLDNTDLDAPEVCGRKLEYVDGSSGDGSGVYTEWDNVTQASLTISSANVTYVNSSTIESGECWTRRKPGVLDMTLSVTEEDNSRSKFTKGQDLFLKLYTSAAEFWHIGLMKVREFTGITVDRESGAIISQTVNLDWNAIRASDNQEGFIIRPNSVEYWPTDQSSTTVP